MWEREGNRDSENICVNIKIKLGFCSGLGKATRNLDVQVKRASVQRGGEDPGALNQQFIFLREAAVEPQAGCSGRTLPRGGGWLKGSSVSSSLA